METYENADITLLKGLYIRDGERYKGVWQDNKVEEGRELSLEDYNVPISVRIMNEEEANKEMED